MDGIMAECVTMADHIEEAMGGGGPGDAAPSDEEELGEDPSEGRDLLVRSS